MKIFKVALLALSTVFISTSVLVGNHMGSKSYARDGKNASATPTVFYHIICISFLGLP